MSDESSKPKRVTSQTGETPVVKEAPLDKQEPPLPPLLPEMPENASITGKMPRILHAEHDDDARHNDDSAAGSAAAGT